ncbi:MAG: hypothetical protein ACJ72O_03025 [Marmoricola sp.]
MRVRAGILVVVLAASVTACGGGGDDKVPSAGSTRLSTPKSTPTESVLDCAKYNDTAQKIVRAQQELFSGSHGDTKALDDLKASMDGLKDGAPSNVRAAVDELNQAFDKVQEIMSQPTSEAQQELAEMAPKLSTDGQTITAYIVSQCTK